MDAVAAATAGIERLYKLGEVPASPLMPYGVYSATLGRGDVPGLDGEEGIRWGQIVTQHFAKTSTNAVDHYEATRDALVGLALDITGYDTTPTSAPFDPLGPNRDPDDAGVVGITQTFTFTATKEA